eukprot:s804_g10.t1
MDANDCLVEFKKWADEEFGGVRSAFKVLDADGSGALQFKEFKAACRNYGFPGDCKMLFQCLDQAGEGALQPHEVFFLDKWLLDDPAQYGLPDPDASKDKRRLDPDGDRMLEYFTDTPGPGHYKLPDSVAQKDRCPIARYCGAFTMQGRQALYLGRDWRSHVSPAKYSPSMKATARRQPAYTFSRPKSAAPKLSGPRGGTASPTSSAVPAAVSKRRHSRYLEINGNPPHGSSCAAANAVPAARPLPRPSEVMDSLDPGVSLLSEDSHVGLGRPMPTETDFERLLEDSVEMETQHLAPSSPEVAMGPTTATAQATAVSPVEVLPDASSTSRTVLQGCDWGFRAEGPGPSAGRAQDSWAMVGLSGRLEDLCRDLRRSVESLGIAWPMAQKSPSQPCSHGGQPGWRKSGAAAQKKALGFRSLGATAALTAALAAGSRPRPTPRARPASRAQRLQEPLLREDLEADDFEDTSTNSTDATDTSDSGREMAESSSVIKPKTTNTRILELWPGISDALVDFGGLPIPQRLADAFTERGIVSPAPIQQLVMPKLAQGDHIIVHAPTGGGKTLAYLLPMLARLQPTMHVGVQALIFVPTPELALQVGRELKWLFYVLSGGADAMCWFNPQVPQEIACQVLLSRSNLWDAVRQDAAVMICTPGLILSELRMLKWEARRFRETLALFMASNVNSIICDEVDALTPAVTQGRGPMKLGATEHVAAYVLDVVRSRYRNRPVQLVASSATSNSNKVAAFLDRLMEKRLFKSAEFCLQKYPKRRDAGRRSTPELVQDSSTVQRVGAQAGQTRPNVFVPMPQGIQHCLALVEDKDKGPLLGRPRYEAMVEIVKNLQGSLALNGVNHGGKVLPTLVIRPGSILIFVPERVKLDSMDLNFERTPRKRDHWRSAPAEQDINPLLALQQYQEFVDDVNQEECRRVLVAKMDQGRGIDLPNVKLARHWPGHCPKKWNIIDGVEFRLGIGFSQWDIEAGKSTGLPATSEDVLSEEEAILMPNDEPAWCQIDVSAVTISSWGDGVEKRHEFGLSERQLQAQYQAELEAQRLRHETLSHQQQVKIENLEMEVKTLSKKLETKQKQVKDALALTGHVRQNLLARLAFDNGFRMWQARAAESKHNQLQDLLDTLLHQPHCQMSEMLL